MMMTCKSKIACQKLWGIIVVVLALLVGVLATLAAPRIGLMHIASVVRFIQFMLLILGVGALIKYLFSCGPCACICTKKDGSDRI